MNVNGCEFLIDDCDIPLIEGKKIRLGGNGYIYANSDMLHRLIMNPPKGGFNMFHVGDKVAIKLFGSGLPIGDGVITYDFGNGVYRVALDDGNEYMFDGEQLEVMK